MHNMPHSIDTWLHILLHCTRPHIHALQIQRHNKAIWEIRKLFLSHPDTRSYITMNVETFNQNPLKNTIPSWLVNYTCHTPRCHYIARFKPNILYITSLPYQASPPTNPDPRYTIHFIEFTYTNDRFFEERVQQNINKYTPLL